MGTTHKQNNTSNEQLRSKRVELIVRQLESLPTLPAVATRLLQSATAERISTKEVVSLIEADQALTARILSLARKAHLGIRSSVNTVEKAVLLLGFEAVRNAVLSVKVFETFGVASSDESAFDRIEFWKHSLAVACSAQLIGEKLADKCQYDESELFVCGLLHDIGKVALDTALPKSFARIVKIAENNRSGISDVERRILGIDHCGLGKRLAEYWNLPEPIIYSIWLHHHKACNLPDSIEYRDLAQIIYLADLIARQQRIGFSGNFIFADKAEDVCKEIGISSDDYRDILTALRSAIGERADILGLNEVTSESLYRQALQDANIELGRLNHELSHANNILRIRAKYFDAINELYKKLAPNLPSSEMLKLLARSTKKALDITPIVVYRQNVSQNYIEAGFANAEKIEHHLFDYINLENMEFAFERENLIADPPECLSEILAYFSRRFPDGEMKVIGLKSNDKLVGGIIFSVDEQTLNRLEQEKQELNAFCVILGLILANSIALESAEFLSEELLAINRKMKELEQKLVESKYLSGLGELAAGAAHELNNPLAIISGRAQLLISEESDEQKQKALNIIVEQASRASDIITNLMDFARPVRPQPEIIDIDNFLHNLVNNFVKTNELSSENISIDISDEAKSVFCDRQQLGHVIREILANSLESVDEEENLKIEINVIPDDERENIFIRISDNGPGMTPDVLNRALEPFFSARKAGRRQGLGLSRAYRYIQSNNGILWIDSKENEGTTIHIKLPAKSKEKENEK